MYVLTYLINDIPVIFWNDSPREVISTVPKNAKAIFVIGINGIKNDSHTKLDISNKLYTNILTAVFFNLDEVNAILFLYEAINPIIKSTAIKNPIAIMLSCNGASKDTTAIDIFINIVLIILSKYLI